MPVLFLGLTACIPGPNSPAGDRSNPVRLTVERPLVLKADQDSYDLRDYAWAVYEDPGRQLTIRDILQLPPAVFTFRDGQKAVGYSRSAFWIRLPVRAEATERDYVLEVNYPLIDDARLYVYEDGRYVEQRNGQSVAFVKREIRHFQPVFKLPVDDLHPEHPIYLRIIGERAPLNLPPLIREARTFWEIATFEKLFHGMYAGILTVMILYNLFLFVSIREGSYLQYVLFVASFLLMMLTLSGIGAEYLWPATPAAYAFLIHFSVYNTAFFVNSFARSYLRTRDNSPVMHRILSIMMLLAYPLWLLEISLPEYLVSLKSYFSFVTILAVMTAGGISLWRGDRPARFYMAAWGLLFFGASLYIFYGLGLVPDTFFTRNAIQFGSALEVWLLSLGLADRFNLIKEEKEFARREALKSRELAIESLQRADRLKDEFLANTSHELRTPLNGIIGLAESCLFSAEDPERLRRNLGMIISSGQRLSSLVNDILDFSKLKNGELQLQLRAVDAEKIGELVLQVSMPLAERKGLQLKGDFDPDLPLAAADENRLQQILLNLVGNAVKFTPPGGDIRLIGKREGERIRLAVYDTGIGISEDQQQRIFDSFEQADGTIAREFGGSGLGLSIVSSLTRLHGSEIELDSRVGEGSVFSFLLERAGPELKAGGLTSGDETRAGDALLSSFSPAPEIHGMPIAAGRAAARDKRFHGERVLVVDDEPVNIQVLEDYLSDARIEVSTATDGFQALEMISGKPPDLVLLDLMMPRISGFDVCRTLREEHPASELPIIILSAKNQVTDLVAALEAGANDYITKPFSRRELLARVETHLKLRDTLQELQGYAGRLEQMVEKRTEDLKEKTESLENALADLRKMQEQIISQEKLASLGQLTAGIAHEIKNPLNFVNNFADMSRRVVEDMLEELAEIPTEQRESLQELLEIIQTNAGKIYEHGGRIDRIVRGMLMHARDPSKERELTDLETVLKEDLDLVYFGTKTRSGLFLPEIERDFEANLPRVPVFVQDMSRVFVNLARNAFDSLQERAERAEAEDDDTYRPLLRVSLRREGEFVIIEFYDNGEGVQSEHRQRIFTPFFTTKPSGIGVGLGLSLSHDVVVGKHGGQLRFDSEAGNYARFTITLPLRPQTPAAH